MARTCEVWLYVRIPRNIRMINYAPFHSLLNACFSFVLLSVGSILCALSEYFERIFIFLSGIRKFLTNLEKTRLHHMMTYVTLLYD